MASESTVSDDALRSDAAGEEIGASGEMPANSSCAADGAEEDGCSLSDMTQDDSTLAEFDAMADSEKWLPGGFSHLRVVTCKGSTCCSTKFAAQNSACCKAVYAVQAPTCADPLTLERLSCPFSQSCEQSVKLFHEVSLLLHMKHENVVGLIDCFGSALTSPIGDENSYNELFIVTSRNPYARSLRTIIRTETLKDDHVRFITYQILRGLKYLHSAGIVHGDLRPGTVVIDEACQVMIADLGMRQHVAHSATSSPVQPPSAGTPMVETVTNFDFPATVVRTASTSVTGTDTCVTPLEFTHVLSNMKINTAVDVWGVGCIMAELITCRPLFRGTDHINQLVEILLLTGVPAESVIDRLPEDESVRKFAESSVYITQQSRPFEQVFAGADGEAITLLKGMLCMSASERISVHRALEHKYVEEFHDAADEPTTVPCDVTLLAASCSVLQVASDVQTAMNTAIAKWKGRKLKRIRPSVDELLLASPPIKRRDSSSSTVAQPMQPATGDAGSLTLVLSA